jgi:hypothetical protein
VDRAVRGHVNFTKPINYKPGGLKIFLFRFKNFLVDLPLTFIFAILSKAPLSKSGLSLTHGVTVALQILVLSVKVRILMGQQKIPFVSGGGDFCFQSC